MSGAVSCALPSVAAHQSVGQQTYTACTHQAELYKHLRPTSVSLPPLTRYPEPSLTPRNWGEDNILVHPRCPDPDSSERNNFNCCHSVPDVLPRKYEGYMYPKPMNTDLREDMFSRVTALYRPNMNIDPGLCVTNHLNLTLFAMHLSTLDVSAIESLSGDSAGKCFLPTTLIAWQEPNDLFHSNVGVKIKKLLHQSYKHNNRSYALEDATRQALSEYIARLYGTSRYDLTYKDTSEFMARRADRDKQYYEFTPDEAPTCCRVLNHPDPCPYCWTGGMNKPIKRVNDTEETNQETANTSCDQCSDSSCNGGDNCSKTTQGVFSKTTEGPANNIANIKGVGSKQQMQASTDATGKGDADALGPWSGYPVDDDSCEPLILSHVYNFKLPSSHHNEEMENEYTSSFTERHPSPQLLENQSVITDNSGTQVNKVTTSTNKHSGGKGGRCPTVKLLPKREPAKNGGIESSRNHVIISDNRGASRMPPLPAHLRYEEGGMKIQRNSWTNRDEYNNLRVPCISRIIGCMNKTAAHNRIHAEHPSPVPDVRDSKRYSKRVFFFGYNSSVFQ